MEFLCRVKILNPGSVSAADRFFLRGSLRIWKIQEVHWGEEWMLLERCSWRETFWHWRSIVRDGLSLHSAREFTTSG